MMYITCVMIKHKTAIEKHTCNTYSTVMLTIAAVVMTTALATRQLAMSTVDSNASLLCGARKLPRTQTLSMVIRV